ncbi:TPA: hypothetical protein ACH3X1_008758 [Trebouxia sp. C0004]
MPSGQSATAPAVYSAPTGQVRPSLGPTAEDAGSQEQAWSPTSAYQFESPTFRNGAAHQLSPGPSGRTWSAAASDVMRLTVPQAEPRPVPSHQKDSIAVLDDLLQHALEGLQVKAQLDTGSLPRKTPKQTAMKKPSVDAQRSMLADQMGCKGQFKANNLAPQPLLPLSTAPTLAPNQQLEKRKLPRGKSRQAATVA